MTNINVASGDDRKAVVELVGKLLAELGGTLPPPEDMALVFDEFTDGEDKGFVVLAESGGRGIAVCTVSFVQAMRTRGRYAIIQEMFVEQEWRSTGVGMEVLNVALKHAVARGCQTVELGAPYHGDRQIQFYKRAGFTEVGARLRWRADP